MHFHQYRDWTKLKTVNYYEFTNPSSGYLYTKVSMVAKCKHCDKPKFKVYELSNRVD